MGTWEGYLANEKCYPRTEEKMFPKSPPGLASDSTFVPGEKGDRGGLRRGYIQLFLVK